MAKEDRKLRDQNTSSDVDGGNAGAQTSNEAAPQTEEAKTNAPANEQEDNQQKQDTRRAVVNPQIAKTGVRLAGLGLYEKGRTYTVPSNALERTNNAGVAYLVEVDED